MEKKKSLINWGVVSKHRNELFGLSIITIIFYHYLTMVPKEYVGEVLQQITIDYKNWVRSIGVEVFLFLSGMGLCFSMKKDASLFRFYWRRLRKIVPIYVVWGLLYWGIYDLLIKKLPLNTFLLDFGMITFWRDGDRTYWFITFILLAYLLFPLFYCMLRQERAYRKYFFLLLEMLLVLGVLYLRIGYPEIYKNTEIAFQRFPVFVLGIYYGEAIYSCKKFSLLDCVLVLGAIGYKATVILAPRGALLVNKDYAQMALSLYAMGLIVVISLFLSLFPKWFPLRLLLEWTGRISLELYLTHIGVRNVMIALGYKMISAQRYIICVLISLFLSILLHALGNACNQTSKRKER